MILKNSFLTATFSTKGAELKSLLTDSGKELIWQADPQYWAKSSPVLFPIVGALRNDSYTYEEKEYSLPRHGFARDLEFNVAYQTEDEICFELMPTEATKAMYPFDFIFHIIYNLMDTELLCTYKVFNPSSKNLIFSLGAHPAFALGNTKEEFENYSIFFPEDISLECTVLENGLISDETKNIVLKNKSLPMSYELFYNDALVIEELNSNKLYIRNTMDEAELEFSFNDFPYFGIWSAKDANFVCLEPWCGIADAVDHNQELTEKEGMITLGKHQAFERSWKINYKE